MVRNVIVGSGPAAAGVALALSQARDQQVTVLDIGEQLEREPRDALARMAVATPQRWAERDVETIRAQPVAQVRGELPQKRTYGSDYPFRDAGQLTGVDGGERANKVVVSPAYGGFSNVWGAQIMPFSRSTFARWPISWDDMEPHYRAVLREVPLAAEHDDYDASFPMLTEPQALPALAPRTVDVLQRYERARSALQARGVTVGRARLAVATRGCIRCGLCLTGCPYSLIYSAAQTFDRLRAAKRVNYRSGVLAHRVGQCNGQAFVVVRNVRTGRDERFDADRVFVACGGLGTTRLVQGSLAVPPAGVDVAESAQFVVPFLSRRPVVDPRTTERSTFTLNQFNIRVDFDGEAYNTSQVHCYPHNPAFFAALPALLRHPAADIATRNLLRRITVGLGYLPSWASPRVRLTFRRGGGLLPEMTVARGSDERPPMLRSVMRRLAGVAPKLDLWPMLPLARLSGAAKSYHFGGSFPHSSNGRNHGRYCTDRSGRLPEWDRVHLVDGSVFPSVPSTTFTLTVMANAHRIASETLAEGGLRG